MVAATRAAEILEAVDGFLWPVVVGVLLWRLFPTIKGVLSSRDYTIEVGRNRITVQNASDQLHKEIADLRRDVEALREPRETGEEAAAPIEEFAAAEVVEPSAVLKERLRILWVDGKPQNNAFVIKSFRDEDVDVVEAVSTADALDALSGRLRFDLVITDMGRDEGQGYRAQAGVELINAMRDAKIRIPVVVYASQPALARSAQAALDAGAAEVTSSSSQLMRTVRIAPTTAFEREVAEQLRRLGPTRAFPVRRTFDFLVERGGRRVGIEIKNWGAEPSPEKVARALEEVARARSMYDLDEVLVVVPEKRNLPAEPKPPEGISFVTPDELDSRLR